MFTTKTYKIEIELPEGNDEWWEELAKKKSKAAQKMICKDLDAVLQQSGFFARKIKVVKTTVHKFSF